LSHKKAQKSQMKKWFLCGSVHPLCVIFASSAALR